MKILFNDLARFRERSGVGGYIEELWRCLSKTTDVQCISHAAWGKPLRQLLVGAPASNTETGTSRLLRRVGHDCLEIYLRAAEKFSRHQIFHEPDLIPLLECDRTVVTAHDLSVVRFPQWHPQHRVIHYEKRLARLGNRVARFMADSIQTKQDLTSLLGIAGDRIDVVHLAPRNSVTNFAKSPIRTLSLPEKYILYAGTIEPRKNIGGLLTGFQLFREKNNKLKLVLVGGRGWNSEGWLDAISKSQDTLYLGYLADSQLAECITYASAFVYPSHFEGFGLPPLEAMALGVPVISSHGGSLAEIVGNAAEIIDPNDPQSISNAMHRVTNDITLAKDLVMRGKRWVTRYDWRITAEQVLKTYQKALA